MIAKKTLKGSSAMLRLIRKFNSRWNRIRVPYKLMLIYIPLIIGPALLSMYYLTNNYANEAKVNRISNMTDLLNVLGKKLDDQVHTFEKLSRQIMTDTEIMTLATKQPETTYDRFLIESAINNKLNAIWLNADNNSYIRAIIIATDDQIYTYGKSSILNYDVLDPVYQEKVEQKKGGAVWFEPQAFSDGFSETLSFRLARAIKDPKLHHLGHLTLIIDTKLFTDQFDATVQDIPIKLLDADGEVLLSNEIVLDSNKYQADTYSQEPMYTGWSLSAELPLQQLYASIYDTVKTAVMLISICAVIGLLVTHLLVKDLVIPIRKLLRNMKQSIRGVKAEKLQHFAGAVEIVEMNDTLISLMYEIENLIEEKTKQEHKKKNAELRALQQQLSPHFLYNTLNSIRWMAIIQKQDHIKDMLDALNRLLTYGLRGDEKLVPMRTDFAVLDDYVKIQRVRYQHFELICQIPEELLDIRIPKFLLQPLIENSLIHALAHADRPGVITIQARAERDYIWLDVIDNGIGMSEEQLLKLKQSKHSEDKHFGFHSVVERVQLHYGEQYGVFINSEQQKGTIVTLKIPKQEGALYA